MTMPTVARDPRARYSKPQTAYAVCYDSIPYIANRIHRMVSWGRPITAIRRYLDRDSGPGQLTVLAGVKLGEVDLRQDDRQRSYAFRLDITSYLSDIGGHGMPDAHGYEYHMALNPHDKSLPKTDEQFLWNAYHQGGEVRRHMRYVMLSGGLDGPGQEDRVTDVRFGPYGVGEEITWVFDTVSYWAAWSARGDRLNPDYSGRGCQDLVTESGFRVSCQDPLTEGVCPNAAEHTPYEQPDVWTGVKF